MFAKKDFHVKPVSIVSISDCVEPPSRVKSLLRLSGVQLCNLFFSAELEKEPRTTSKVSELEQFYSELPLCVKEGLYTLILQSLNHKQEKNYSMGRSVSSSETSFLAWFLFQSQSSNLQLSEFIGDGGGREIFQYILESDTSFSHISKVSIGSTEISGEKLSYLFEITDTVWKPELRTFFRKLPNLTHLILRYCCDDDTLSMVGKSCRNLQYLKIQLIPESVKEQQVTDDGFDELISSQEKFATLKEIDIKDCFSDSISSKTILSLSRIPSLVSLHLRSFHFRWLKLTLRLNSDRYSPNTSLTSLSINFYSNLNESFIVLQDNVDGVPEPEFVRGVLENIPRLFPALRTVQLDGVNNDILETLEDNPTVVNMITLLRNRKCPRLLDIAGRMPSLGTLEFDCFPLERCYGVVLRTLTVLKISRDIFRQCMDYEDLKAILVASPKLKELYLDKISVQVMKTRNETYPISEDQFLDLFRLAPHLRNLSVLALNFSKESNLTERTVYFLLETCRNLRKLENLITWSIGKDSLDPDLLRAKYGMGIVYGSRYHWSLHWRGEDGQFYDSELPVDRF